ncbi:MAG: extracellular solute-binding protein [Bacillota bacterium]
MLRQKWIYMLTLIVIAFSIVTGCSYGGNEKASETTKKSSSTKTESGKFDPVVEINTARPTGAYKFKDGEDITNNVHTKWAEEELGIKINHMYEAVDNAAYHTKIRLALTSQETLPDVFVVQNRGLVADLMESGKVMDIQDAFDKYASDRLKKIYEENDSGLNQVKVNGRLMGLPIFTPGDATDPLIWVRQDWLDNLNLESPTTIEEFEKVMDAFTNNDPDGNGKDDTFGFTFSGSGGYLNWMSDASFVFGAYTGKYLPKTYQISDNGKLVYGSTQPGTKEALGKLREWYSKGYLDKELAILDPVKATESFIQGKAGMIAAPSFAYDWPLKDILGNHPDAKVVPYKLPTGPDGKTARFGSTLNENKVILFNKDFKNMEAFFVYLDKMYDREFETGDFKYGYAEGYDYALVDGKPVYDPEKHIYDPGQYSFLWGTPMIPFKYSTDQNYIYEGNEPKTNSQDRISQANENTIKAGALNYQMREISAPDVFLGGPTETMETKGENLTTMEVELFNKIVYGKVPLDSYDQFVKDWYEKGGTQIEKEVNEWYESVNQ